MKSVSSNGRDADSRFATDFPGNRRNAHSVTGAPLGHHAEENVVADRSNDVRPPRSPRV